MKGNNANPKNDVYFFLLSDILDVAKDLIHAFQEDGRPLTGLPYQEEQRYFSTAFQYPKEWEEQGLEAPFLVGCGAAFRDGWSEDEGVCWVLLREKGDGLEVVSSNC